MKSLRNCSVGEVSYSIWIKSRSRVSVQKLVQLGRNALLHPPYSPDLAPSGFHLFRSPQNSFNEKKFSSLEACRRKDKLRTVHHPTLPTKKDGKFCEDWILKVPQECQNLIDSLYPSGGTFRFLLEEITRYALRDKKSHSREKLSSSGIHTVEKKN